MPRWLNRNVSWIAVAWLVLIVSGASTTGLLRAPIANPAIVPFAFESHRFAGTVVGVVAVVWLFRARRRRTWPWLGMALATAAVAGGWLAARSLTPRIVVAHASLAAFATIALASPRVSSPTIRRRAAWIHLSARLALGLVLAQVVVGALLRHQLIDLVWHLLVGGLAVIALLVPAVAIVQDPSALAAERRAAKWAIASVVVQVSLGVAVLLMILIGPPSVEAWLAATIAHVTVGSLTLLASANFARVL